MAFPHALCGATAAPPIFFVFICTAYWANVYHDARRPTGRQAARVVEYASMPMNRHVTNDKSQVQVIARAATILRALEEENAGLSLGQIAQRVNLARSTVQRIVCGAGNRKAGDRRDAERPRAARPHHPAAGRLGAQRLHRAGAAVPRAAERGIARDRRSLDGEEGSPRLHRPGDRLAAPAHRVGGRRNLSALLHRQRQGLSGAAVRCRPSRR